MVLVPKKLRGWGIGFFLDNLNWIAKCAKVRFDVFDDAGCLSACPIDFGLSAKQYLSMKIEDMGLRKGSAKEVASL